MFGTPEVSEVGRTGRLGEFAVSAVLSVVLTGSAGAAGAAVVGRAAVVLINENVCVWISAVAAVVVLYK